MRSSDDYKALRSLYLTTDGDNWTKKLGWPNRTFFVNNTNIPPNIDMSNWFGITCSNYRVIKVSLPKNNLKGVLSNFPLAELETLILDENELQGNIPNFNLTKLETLSLRSNKFFGNIPIFNFLSLKSLDLSYNNLTGIMPSFENMSELLTLKLDHNKLTGNVPNFNLPKLENLEIQFNQLNGSIPTLNLPKIINLILDGNNFTGKIPNFNFSNLIKLSLSMNSLFGEIPALELPMLQELNLNNNKLSGNIPNFQSPNLQTLNHCQGTYKNTSFFGFVAGSGAYDIQFTIFNCAGKGVQYGIMNACSPGGPFEICDSSATGSGQTVTISSSILVPCRTYIFWINGYEGSVCSYYANVTGDFNYCKVPYIEDIKIESACTPLCPSLKPLTITAVPELFFHSCDRRD